MTALEAAAKYGRLDTVQILLNAGAASSPETRKQIANAIALANDQGHLAVSRLLGDHARTSGMSEILQDDSDVNLSDDNFSVDDLSDEENGHETADYDEDLNDRSGEMHFEEFYTDEPMMNVDDIVQSAQSYQLWTDFGGWDGAYT